MDFFQKVFSQDKIGLSLEVKDKDSEIGDSKPARGLMTHALAFQENKIYQIHFIRPYPIYIYLQLSECAATGEWEERR